ncbi:MAG: hypothetical protein H6Q00_720 [Holophagaceae bacterium]|nr:hypothetical protein [Holophagaceae bacterium]
MSPPPAGEHPVVADHYWRFCRQGGQVSTVLYLLFLVTFLTLGLWAMATLTGITLIIQGWALSRLPWRSKEMYELFVVFFVIGYSILAMRGVGTDAEFHLYALSLLSMPSGYKRFKLARKTAMALAIIVLFVVIDPWTRAMSPLWPLPPGALHTVRTMNIVGLCVFISAISYQSERTLGILTRSLVDMATTDPLTGLLNRRRMEEMAAVVQNGHERHQRPFLVILGDLDHFKAINDQHSHAGGDLALKAVAECLLASVRAEDQVARWGGEEFLLLLPETTLTAGLEVAERIRKQVSQLVLNFDGKPIPVTITLGVAQGGSGSSFTQALGKADEALYQGKASGRNRVEVAKPEP